MENNEKKLPAAIMPPFLVKYATERGFDSYVEQLGVLYKQARDEDNRGLFYFLKKTLNNLSVMTGYEKEYKPSHETYQEMKAHRDDEDEQSADDSEEGQDEEDGPKELQEQEGGKKKSDKIFTSVVLLWWLAKKTLAQGKDGGPWVTRKQADEFSKALQNRVAPKLTDKLQQGKGFAKVGAPICKSCDGEGVQSVGGEPITCTVCGGKGRTWKQEDGSSEKLGTFQTVYAFYSKLLDASLDEVSPVSVVIPDPLSAAQRIIKSLGGDALPSLDKVNRDMSELGLNESQVAGVEPADPSTIELCSPRQIAEDLKNYGKTTKKTADMIAKKLRLENKIDDMWEVFGFEREDSDMLKIFMGVSNSVIFRVVQLAYLTNISARLNVASKVAELLNNETAKTYFANSKDKINEYWFNRIDLTEQIEDFLRNQIQDVFTNDDLANSVYGVVKHVEIRNLQAELRSKQRVKDKEARAAQLEKDKKKAEKAKAASPDDDEDIMQVPKGAYSSGVRDLTHDEAENVIKGKLTEAKKKPEKSPEMKKAESDLASLKVKLQAMFGARSILAKVIEVFGEITVPGVESEEEGRKLAETFYMDSILFPITATHKFSEYAPGERKEGGFKTFIEDSIAKDWIVRLGKMYLANMDIGKTKDGSPVFFKSDTPGKRAKFADAANQEIEDAASQYLEFVLFQRKVAKTLPKMIHQRVTSTRQPLVKALSQINRQFAAILTLAQNYQQSGSQETVDKLLGILNNTLKQIEIDPSGVRGRTSISLAEQMMKVVANLNMMSSFSTHAYDELIREAGLDNMGDSGAFGEIANLKNVRDAKAFKASVDNAFNLVGVKGAASEVVARVSQLAQKLTSFSRDMSSLDRKAKPMVKTKADIEKEQSPNYTPTSEIETVLAIIEEYVPAILKLSDVGAEDQRKSVLYNLKVMDAGASKISIVSPKFTASDNEGEQVDDSRVPDRLFQILVGTVRNLFGETSKAKPAPSKQKEIEAELRATIIGSGKQIGWAEQTVIEAEKSNDPKAYVENAVGQFVSSFSAKADAAFTGGPVQGASFSSLSGLSKETAAEKEMDPASAFVRFIQQDVLSYKIGSTTKKTKAADAVQKKLDSILKRDKEKDNAGMPQKETVAKKEILAAIKRVIDSGKFDLEIQKTLVDDIYHMFQHVFKDTPTTKNQYMTGAGKVLWKGKPMTLFDIASLVVKEVVKSVENDVNKYTVTSGEQK